LLVDRLNRRVVACANFLLQALAMPPFMLTSAAAPCLSCALLGTSVGNMASLPGLILRKEFPKADFVCAVSLVLAICNFTYAFGQEPFGLLKTAPGGYANALMMCCGVQFVVAAVVLIPKIRAGVRTGRTY
jgi:hypothetical protein